MFRVAAVALCALVYVSVVLPALAAGPIFPTPIHITREVHDSISDKTIVLNEYGYGNRLVSVRGDLTAIADYEKGEVTEIDRKAGTFSVTRFETIAKVMRLQGGAPVEPATPQAPGQSEIKPLGARETKSGRPADFFRSESDGGAVEVAVDRTIRLSQEALEVLLGTAYPGTSNRQVDVVVAAAGGGGGRREAMTNSEQQQRMYALPLEQRFELEVGDERAELRSSVLRVGTEPPPAEVLAIPAGARMVESRTTLLVRELELIDSPPLRPPGKP